MNFISRFILGVIGARQQVTFRQISPFFPLKFVIVAVVAVGAVDSLRCLVCNVAFTITTTIYCYLWIKACTVHHKHRIFSHFCKGGLKLIAISCGLKALHCFSSLKQYFSWSFDILQTNHNSELCMD